MERSEEMAQRLPRWAEVQAPGPIERTEPVRQRGFLILEEQPAMRPDGESGPAVLARDFLDLEACAEYVGVSTDVISEWVNREDMPHTRTSGTAKGKLIFSRRLVQDWLEGRMTFRPAMAVRRRGR